MKKFVAGFSFAALLAPLAAVAQAPSFTYAPDVFTEHRGAAAGLWDEDNSLLIVARSVVPSGAGTVITATHVGGSGPDYLLGFVPAPIYPNMYAVRSPYVGQTGQWNVTASSAGGDTSSLTHVLDDVRYLPLVTGLSVSGPLLTPTLTWAAVSAATYPGSCGVGGCVTGSDVFGYGVVVQRISGIESNPAPLVLNASIPIGSATPSFTIPAGFLSYGNDYLLGVQLKHSEYTEGKGWWLENRSVAYVPYAVPIPEPETWAMMLAGLGFMGWYARRRKELSQPTPA